MDYPLSMSSELDTSKSVGRRTRWRMRLRILRADFGLILYVAVPITCALIVPTLWATRNVEGAPSLLVPVGIPSFLALAVVSYLAGRKIAGHQTWGTTNGGTFQSLIRTGRATSTFFLVPLLIFAVPFLIIQGRSGELPVPSVLLVMFYGGYVHMTKRQLVQACWYLDNPQIASSRPKANQDLINQSFRNLFGKDPGNSDS